MIGLDTYSATKHSLGVDDWLSLASGALKTAGGATAALNAPGKSEDQIALDKARLEAQRKAAEKSAATWKTVGYVVLGTVVVGGGWWWLHR